MVYGYIALSTLILSRQRLDQNRGKGRGAGIPVDSARGRLTGRLVAALRAPAVTAALDAWARALRAETAALDALTLARPEAAITLARLGEGTR